MPVISVKIMFCSCAANILQPLSLQIDKGIMSKLMLPEAQSPKYVSRPHAAVAFNQLGANVICATIQDSKLNVKTEDNLLFSKVDKLFDSYKRFIRIYCNDDKQSVLEKSANTPKFSRERLARTL